MRVDAAAQARPVGENRTHFIRASCQNRRMGMDISPAPRLAPVRLVSNLSSRSLPSRSSMRSTLIPASLMRLLSKNSSVPSSERFSETWIFSTLTPSPSLSHSTAPHICYFRPQAGMRHRRYTPCYCMTFQKRYSQLKHDRQAFVRRKRPSSHQ